MAGVGAVVVEKWIQLYLNNNKKIKNNSRKKKELKKRNENRIRSFWDISKRTNIFRIEGQIKCFPDKVKLKEFISTTSSLFDMLMGTI